MQSCFGFFFFFLLFWPHTNLQNLWQIIHQHLKYLVKVVVIIIKSKLWLNWLFFGPINLGIWFHFSLTTRRTDRSSRLNFGKFTKNSCPRESFLIKLQASSLQLSLKKTLYRSFPVNFAKFLRTTFLQDISGACCRTYQNPLSLLVITSHRRSYKTELYVYGF